MWRTAATERIQLQHLDLLERQLAELAASQRGATRVLPPQTSDYAGASPSERARVAALLRDAGLTDADVARGESLLRTGQGSDATPIDRDPVDAFTRRRAQSMLRGRW